MLVDHAPDPVRLRGDRRPGPERRGLHRRLHARASSSDRLDQHGRHAGLRGHGRPRPRPARRYDTLPIGPSGRSLFYERAGRRHAPPSTAARLEVPSRDGAAPAQARPSTRSLAHQEPAARPPPAARRTRPAAARRRGAGPQGARHAAAGTRPTMNGSATAQSMSPMRAWVSTAGTVSTVTTTRLVAVASGRVEARGPAGTSAPAGSRRRWTAGRRRSRRRPRSPARSRRSLRRTVTAAPTGLVGRRPRRSGGSRMRTPTSSSTSPDRTSSQGPPTQWLASAPEDAGRHRAARVRPASRGRPGPTGRRCRRRRPNPAAARASGDATAASAGTPEQRPAAGVAKAEPTPNSP